MDRITLYIQAFVTYLSSTSRIGARLGTTACAPPAITNGWSIGDFPLAFALTYDT
ncbi:MAG: hypothetical protein ACPGU1_11380 [Myxococcota bacterium]